MSRLSTLSWVSVLWFVVVSCASAGGGSGETPTACGNGTIDPLEQCDGVELGGQTCVALGYKAGQLACNPTTCQLDIEGCCADECATLGDTICQGDVLATCTDLAAGCRAWDPTENCADQGRICTTSGAEARCKEPLCVDECPVANASQCNGNVVETCNIGLDGCTTWTQATDCAATGKSCDATSGAAECVTVCADQCTVGATQCSGNVIQTCVQAGECTAWENGTNCSSNGEVCATPSGTAECVPACTTNKCPTEGLETCLSSAVNTCTKDSNGCLDWVVTEDCAAQSLLCKFQAGGQAICQGVCTSPCPTQGEKKCNANLIQECQATPANCLEWKTTTTCPLGQTCSSSGSTYQCVTGQATGEDCGTVFPVQGGMNTVDWTATTNNYLTVNPSCNSVSYPVEGPDVVLVYTSPINGSIDFTLTKPTNQRIVVVAAAGSCGSLANQLACVADYSLSSMGGSFNVTQGSTYFFYIGDTSQPAGANLPDPLSFNIAEIDCSTFNASGINFNPAKGSTTTTLSPKLVVDFDTAVTPSAGTITVTGNQGTNLSFTLPSSSVVFSNANKTMTITPGVALKAGEVVNVAWSGLNDAKCSKPVDPANWSFTVVTPPCAPGQNGMLGTSVTKMNTALNTTYYYLAPDTNPNGYIYIGNTTSLERISKSGGSLQNVNALAGLGATHLGYGMLIDGNDIFTVESKTTGLVGWVWRISTNGGTSWSIQDYLSMTATPGDSWEDAVIYENKMYAVTSETSTSIGTEIWSANAATPPNAATLETSFSGESYCTGLALDDTYYYLACSTGNRLIRRHRVTGVTSLITDQFPLISTKSPVIADDVNNDGTADYLYYKGYRAEVYVVCNPGSTTPYADILVNYGAGTTSNYGLGLDRVNNRLYAWEYATKQIVMID